MNTPTTFRPIKGFPGYAIGETGEVISFKEGSPKFKSAHTNTHGYPTVGLCGADSKMHPKTIHSLVAQAFLGDCPKGYQIDHIDGNKTNNNATNLRYVTPRENVHNPSTFNQTFAARHSKSIIVSRDGVDQVFPSQNEACRQLGLTPARVSKCLLNKRGCCSHRGYTFRYA